MIQQETAQQQEVELDYDQPVILTKKEEDSSQV